MKIIKVLLVLVQICCLVGIVLGFTGAFHAAGDSFAIFRGYLALILLILTLLTLFWMRRWPQAVLVVVSLILIAQAWPLVNALVPKAPDQPQQAYSLYQRNLLFRNPDPARVTEEIARLRPDFITLQEVSPANQQAILMALPAGYESAFCEFSAVGGVAVATRHALMPDEITCQRRRGMIAAEIITPDGPVVLASIHLFWPWPYGQEAQAERLTADIAEFDPPVLIGGDFNMVGWSERLRQFSKASGSELSPQGWPTFNFTWRGRKGPGVEIDHILLPNGSEARVERLGFLGSDHRGLLAHFDL